MNLDLVKSSPMIKETPNGRISYSDVATHTVHTVNDTPGALVIKPDIKTLYIDLQMSGKSIARILEVPSGTIYKRLRAQGVEIRPRYKDPEAEQRRLNGIQRDWDERREEKIKRIHSPEAEAKRSTTMKRIYAQTPEIFDAEKIKKALRKMWDRRIKTALGEDPVARLAQYASQNMTIAEVSDLTGVSIYLIKQIVGKDIHFMSPHIKGKIFPEIVKESPQYMLLNDSQKDVLEAIHGLNGKGRESFKEIATRRGLSKGRIDQIHQNALDKLKRPIHITFRKVSV